MDFGLLTSKCATIPGKIVIPRRATAGIVKLVSLNVKPSFLITNEIFPASVYKSCQQ
jgi:hypothetical protein